MEPFYILCLTIIFIIIALIVLSVKRSFSIDSFENPKQTIIAKNTYDEFYAPVYTMLISEQIEDRTKFEIADLMEKTDIEDYESAKLLDLGCGGGNHLKFLAEENLKNLQLVGIDSSKAMLKETQKNLKNLEVSIRLINKNINDDDLFMKSSFSHITCYYFTMYYIDSTFMRDKIKKWLKPRGWFIVHLVDLEKFDPVLDAAVPLSGINIQKYNKNRITNSSVEFKKFKYDSNFRLGKTKAYFDEKFEFKEKPIIRKQKHILKKIEMDEFINEFGKNGMILKYTTNLKTLGFHHQYILYFQKV
tara:strand:- start:4661 stop:5569 length:909 start_codon:yes stop_codon:yes gene_type:complete